jgi:hypothetical protein
VKKQLPVSAAAINDAHRCARESAENAVEWAIKCGNMLAEVKASLPRGEFDGWVESNCEFGRATAYNYIRASKSSNALDGSAIRHLFPSGRPGAKSNTPKGAVSVVKPKGTEETGEDRPAASATPPERASQPPGAEVRPGARPVEVTPEQKRVAQQVRESLNRQQAQTETEDDAPEQPSDDEIAAIEREIQESEARVLQADDVTAGYHQELKRQAAEIAVLKTTRDGYMRGKDAVTKLLQAEQRKNAKLTKRIQELEKENKALRERLEGKAA